MLILIHVHYRIVLVLVSLRVRGGVVETTQHKNNTNSGLMIPTKTRLMFSIKDSKHIRCWYDMTKIPKCWHYRLQIFRYIYIYKCLDVCAQKNAFFWFHVLFWFTVISKYSCKGSGFIFNSLNIYIYIYIYIIILSFKNLLFYNFEKWCLCALVRCGLFLESFCMFIILYFFMYRLSWFMIGKNVLVKYTSDICWI